MAHLTKCHCGRAHRCDLEHPPPRGFDPTEYRCTPCPDAGAPDHDLPPISFVKFTFPVLSKVFPTVVAADICGTQSMTRPIDK